MMQKEKCSVIDACSEALAVLSSDDVHSVRQDSSLWPTKKFELMMAQKIKDLALEMWNKLQTGLLNVGMRDKKSEFPLEIKNEAGL